MKNESLTEVKLGLSELKKYVEYNSYCNKVISTLDGEIGLSPLLTELVDISKSFRRKKVFEYNSYIISLYGLFERFLENLVSDYLSQLCIVIKDYDKLPAPIVKMNMGLNLDVIKNISNPKYQSLSEKQLLLNLNKAINENVAILNISAFQHHSYNFKQSIITEYLGNIGLGEATNLLKVYDPIKSILIMKYGNPANIPLDILFSLIDDLSQRRNDVAHGVENVQLINSTIILDYIDFIKAYCESIFSIFENNYLNLLYDQMLPNFKLIKVINKTVVCGEVENITIKKGDHLLIKKPVSNFPRFLKCKIEEIQINNVTHDSRTIIQPTDIALRISINVKENNEFKLITS